jgi:hypothetical protein
MGSPILAGVLARTTVAAAASAVLWALFLWATI